MFIRLISFIFYLISATNAFKINHLSYSVEVHQKLNKVRVLSVQGFKDGKIRDPIFPSLKPSKSLLSTANTLTLLRVVSIPFFITSFTLGQRYMSFSIYLLSCITDFADGYIARK